MPKSQPARGSLYFMEPVQEPLPRGVQPCRRRIITMCGLMLVMLVAKAQASGPPLIAVSVKTAPLGRQIPPHFVGMSMEVSTAGQALAPPPKPLQLVTHLHAKGQFVYSLGVPGDPNQGYFQFMRNLGPALLRLGGNSQDNTCWDMASAPHPKFCNAPLTAGDFQLWSAAARATGWHLILGINLKQDAPQWALKEITQGVSRYMQPSEIKALEIGNEPSLFPRDGSRPRSYSPQDQVHDFMAYARAFAANPVPKKFALAGPAACCSWENTKDLDIFMEGARHSNLRLVTVHEYVTTTCGGRTVSIPQLLAPETTERFIRRARRWVVAAHAHGLPMALAETNSTSCGGMTGVSNAFASAVWGLDYMFQVARDGFSSINFHSSYKTGGSAYNPIVTLGTKQGHGRWHYNNIAEPLYYAMYMFARNAEGNHLLPVSVSTHANVRAYAVSACTRCAVRVFLINKDLAASGEARVSVAGHKAPATLLLLRAPSLSSSAGGVRYGGAQFNSEGRIAPPHTTTVRPNAQGEYVFTLPNASAALLTIQ